MILEGCTIYFQLFWTAFRLAKEKRMCYLIDTKKPPSKEILNRAKAFQIIFRLYKIVSEAK